jgi:leucyl-tRNA synthetase
MTDGYDHTTVEQRWQRRWREDDVFAAPDDPDDPRYVLSMFPYTSGAMHMGHVRNYVITDATAHFERMRGRDVLHPMGWDAFGLPAENAARERDTTPRAWTERCIDAMRRQFDLLGLGFDWSREVTTCDPDYYRWNQWLFNRFRDAGLVDRRAAPVNWCPDCETVLADEQVEADGDSEVCWRCETPVETRSPEQWYVTITDYADELVDALDDLDGWPTHVADMQRNWVGRQRGARVTFEVPEHGSVETFTTRADTLFGVTFVAVAPDHPVAAAAEREDAVAEYVAAHADADAPAAHTDREAATDFSGVDTGARAVHPVTGDAVPVYVADFVVGDVGTGAVMGVPGHDERDHAFARQHDLPVKHVVAPEAGDDGWTDAPEPPGAFTDDGVLVDSGEYSGLDSETARERIVEDVDAVEPDVQYRLRDWLISRQRYWGTPIPVVHCEDCGDVSVPDDDLPVELPEYVETTGNPLEAADEWVQTTCPDCGRPARRETDTMNTFVDSSWYFLRFTGAPEDAPFDPDAVADWLPVDRYVGGVEHAVMHLLYARFVTKALDDVVGIGVREPFADLTCQGMVLRDGAKMSKSRGNGVSPEQVVDAYGADTARLFVMQAAAPERDFEWNETGVEAARATLDRLVDATDAVAAVRERDGDRTPADEHVARAVDATVASVTDAYDAMAFDEAVREARDLLSLVDRYRRTTDPDPVTYERAVAAVVRLFAPVAPHVAEECWDELGDGLVVETDWPTPETDPGRVEAAERVVERTREDVREIVDVAGIDDPERIAVVVAPAWTYRAVEIARETDDDDVVGAVMADETCRTQGESAADFAKDLAAAGHVPEPFGPDAEARAIERAAWLVADEFDAEVAVHRADDPDAPVDAVERARPGRPGIVVREAPASTH